MSITEVITGAGKSKTSDVVPDFHTYSKSYLVAMIRFNGTFVLSYLLG